MTRYICLHCFHHWNSNSTGRVLRCSNCHRRQGVNYDRFRKAVEAAKTALRKVVESPPPYRPPLDVVGDIPDALEPVLAVARDEFPNPLIPIALLKGILGHAIEELKIEPIQGAGLPQFKVKAIEAAVPTAPCRKLKLKQKLSDDMPWLRARGGGDV